MKKITNKLLTLMGLVGVLTITSCGEDDGPTAALPSVTLSAQVDGSALSEGDNVEVGATVEFTANITAPGGVNTLWIGSTPVSRAELNVDAGATSASYSFNSTITIEGSLNSPEIYAVDDLDQSSDRVTFSVTGVITSPEARSYTAILLAAPLGDTPETKTSETFFSTNTGLKYSMNQVNSSSDPLSADIDFGYFYGSGTGGTEATLSDPASYPFAYGQAAWGTRNSTTFRRTSLNAAAFTEVTTFADIDAEYEAATAADADPGIESGLVEGEVLAFATDASKTGGSKRGLILVNSIVAGDGETGQISLEVLVQEEASN